MTISRKIMYNSILFLNLTTKDTATTQLFFREHTIQLTILYLRHAKNNLKFDQMLTKEKKFRIKLYRNPSISTTCNFSRWSKIYNRILGSIEVQLRWYCNYRRKIKLYNSFRSSSMWPRTLSHTLNWHCINCQHYFHCFLTLLLYSLLCDG